MTKQESLYERLRGLCLPEGALQNWAALEPPDSTLQKFQVPTQDEIDSWIEETNKIREKGSLSQHGLEALIHIKLPLLVGWTTEEVILAMTPFIRTHCSKYCTKRFVDEDAFQEAAIGIIAALRTDAGKSPFAGHAYTHIRTKVRRGSVGSGLISRRQDGERLPSTIEVRKLVTSWLTKDWVTRHADDIVQKQKLANYATVLGSLVRRHYQQHNPKEHCKISSRISGSLREWENQKKFLTALTAHLKKHDKRSYDKIKKEADKIQSEAIKEAKQIASGFVTKARKAKVPMAKTRLAKASDLRMVNIQKLGNKLAYCNLIRLDFPLEELGIETVWELFSFLEWRYNYLVDDDKSSILGFYNQDRHRTIGDVISVVAPNPDFHGNPLTIEKTSDSEEREFDVMDKKTPDPREISDKNEEEDHKRRLIEMVRNDLDLTYEQEVVLCFYYGFPLEQPEGECLRLAEVTQGSVYEENGKWYFRPVPTSGSWLAENFGKVIQKCVSDTPSGPCGAYRSEHKGGCCARTGCTGYSARRSVSRQRITQYHERVEDRVRASLFKVIFQNKQIVRRHLEQMMDDAGLSPEEKSIAQFVMDVFPYGPNERVEIGEVDFDIDYLSTNYEPITGRDVESLSLSARRSLCKEHVTRIQHKLIKAELK